MKSAKVFCNIGELMSMAGAARKQARRATARDLGLVKKAAMLVVGGQVTWVGKEANLPREYRRCERIDLQGENIFPGFVDCHSHLIFAGERSHEFELRNQGVSYQEIAKKGGGILSTVKATRKTSARDLIILAQKRVDRLVAQGVTAVEVKSGYGLTPKDELKMLEVANELTRARIYPTFLGAHAIPESVGDESQYLAMLSELLPLIKKRKLSRRIDIFIEKGYFTCKKSRALLQKAKDLGFDITIHADQLSRTGATALAVELGALSADHVIEISSADLKMLAQSETTAVLLPAADFYIHAPYPRARELLAAGARCALATDYNPGSSPNLNIALVGLLARLKMKMTLPEVFTAFTLGGAYALGEGERLGALVSGRQADFFVSPASWNDFFYDTLPMPITSVWQKGRRIHKT